MRRYEDTCPYGEVYGDPFAYQSLVEDQRRVVVSTGGDAVDQRYHRLPPLSATADVRQQVWRRVSVHVRHVRCGADIVAEADVSCHVLNIPNDGGEDTRLGGGCVPIVAAEQEIMAGFETGSIVDLSLDDEQRVVNAEVLAQLLTNREMFPGGSRVALRVIGAHIVGVLDLEGAAVSAPVELRQ